MGLWTRETPRPLAGMSMEPATDGGSFAWRAAVATALWLAGAALTYSASGMSWFASPDYDPRFADPVWGTGLLHRTTAPGAALVLLGGLVMVGCWWVSGRVGRSERGGHRRRVEVAVRTARVLRPVLAVLLLGGVLLALRGLALQWAADWVAYPGWSRSVVAQVCALVAVLLLPRPDDPRRWAEAGYGRVRVGTATLISVATLTLPLLPPVLADATAESAGTGVQGDAGAESSGTGQEAETPSPVTVTIAAPGSALRWAQVSAPLGDDAASSSQTDAPSNTDQGTDQSGNQGSDPSSNPVVGDARWWHRWRGAAGAQIVPSTTGRSDVAVLVDASAPQRTALAVLDRSTGELLSRWDADDFQDRGLPPLPDTGRDARLFGRWLVHAGKATEWTGVDGAVIGTVPTTTQQAELRSTQIDGLHGRSTTSDATWFVGDDAACQRRALVDGSGSWVHDEDTVVALELCTDTTPARATLLGIDPTAGSVRWSTAVPGFDTWAAGLDGPVPTLSSIPWPVVVEVSGNEGDRRDGGTSGAGAGDDVGNEGDEGDEESLAESIAATGVDTGRSDFVIQVAGVRHRISTSSGEVLDGRG